MSIPHSTAETTSSEKDKRIKSSYKANDKLITISVHRLQTWKQQVFHLPAIQKGRKMRDPGNEVD